MRPDFSKVDFRAQSENKESFVQWEKENNIQKSWKTPEQIDVKPVYGKEDLAGMEHLNRGPSVSMPVSPPPRSRMLSTAVISRPVRRV